MTRDERLKRAREYHEKTREQFIQALKDADELEWKGGVACGPLNDNSTGYGGHDEWECEPIIAPFLPLEDNENVYE